MPRLVFVVNSVEFLLSHRLVLVRGARDAGYDVHVVGPLADGVRELERQGIPFHPWTLDRGGQRAGSEARSLLQLVGIYRRLRPDIVHHVTIKPVLYGSFAARATRVGAVVNAVSGLGYIFLARGVKARLRRAAIARAYRIALNTPRSIVVFQNDDDEADLRRLGAVGSATIQKIRGSGVDLARFTRRPEPSGTPLVVFPARLLRDKGVLEFVDAARQLRRDGVEVRMALVGSVDPGNPASATEAEAEAWVREGIVEWWGHRPDMPQVFAQANIVCLPSYREGMPKALLEAAAVGRAIVTTDAPGCRDVIRRGELGLLVPVRDGAALANAIARLATSPELRHELADAIASHAQVHFGQDRALEQHLAVYARLLGSLRA